MTNNSSSRVWFYLSLPLSACLHVLLSVCQSVSIYVFLYLSGCMSVCRSVCQSICQYVPFSACLPASLTVYLSVNPNIYPFIHSFVHPIIQLSIRLSIYLSICLSTYFTHYTRKASKSETRLNALPKQSTQDAAFQGVRVNCQGVMQASATYDIRLSLAVTRGSSADALLRYVIPLEKCRAGPSVDKLAGDAAGVEGATVARLVSTVLQTVTAANTSLSCCLTVVWASNNHLIDLFRLTKESKETFTQEPDVQCIPYYIHGYRP